MEVLFHAGEVGIAAHLAQPRSAPQTTVPALVLCHGFPNQPGSAPRAASALPELADRIATELGWLVAAITFRGCGASGGQFSLGGWLEDVVAGVRWMQAMDKVRAVWVAGFGTGGSLAITAGAQVASVAGIAALAAPADFDDWASHPRRLLQHARDVGIIREQRELGRLDDWARQLREIRPVAAAQEMSDRPLLVVHGSDDDLVPAFDARVIADAHGSADLRIIEGGGHQLRHDPRAVAVLLGWLDRQRHASRQRQESAEVPQAPPPG